MTGSQREPALRRVSSATSLSSAARTSAEASTAALCLVLTMLIYNLTLLDEPTVQLLFFICLGFVVQLARYRVPDTTAPLPETVVVEEAPRAAPSMSGLPVYQGR